jgi:ABC-2 type transport system ATP-binding protein
MENVIEISGLTKDYETGFWRKKKVRALDGLTLSVRKGRIFGFLGGNGAGKTTTIKLLMRLLFPTEGSAKILGSDISDRAMHGRIGYCPENPYFYDYLTAIELMEYFGEIFGLNAGDRRARSRELLLRVGLQEKDHRRQLRKFSKGMLQRVGLAQALINEPEVVFLDEPMSGLDPIGRREIRELIASLRDAGITVFMSTHILSDVQALCDEVAILRAGRLAATGRLDELLEQTHGKRAFEISVTAADLNELRRGIGSIAGISMFEKPNGAALQVEDEENIEPALKIVREAGGKLLSVHPVKQSLEELFVRETAAEDQP